MIRSGSNGGNNGHVPLTSFQEGPHAFHDAPEFIFAFEYIMDMPIEFVRASGANRRAFNVWFSPTRKGNDWPAIVKREGWPEAVLAGTLKW